MNTTTKVFAYQHDDGISYVTLSKMCYYNNKRVKLNLTEYPEGFPYGTATVNIPEVKLQENEIIIKDNNENEGMMNLLTENNIITPTNKTAQSGYCTYHIAILKPENEWGEGISEDLKSSLLKKFNSEEVELEFSESKYLG